MRIVYNKSKKLLKINSFSSEKIFDLQEYFSDTESLFIKGEFPNDLFEKFKNLKNVKIKAKAIPACTFYDNNNLENVQIDAKEIKNNAFLGCKNLKNVDILNEDCELDYSAFNSCPNIENFNVTKVGAIGFQAILDCKIKNLYISLDSLVYKNAFPNTKIENLHFDYNKATYKDKFILDFDDIRNIVISNNKLIEINSSALIFNTFEKGEQYITIEAKNGFYIGKDFDSLENVETSFRDLINFASQSKMYNCAVVLNLLNKQRKEENKKLLSFPPNEVVWGLPKEYLIKYFMVQKKFNKLVKALNGEFLFDKLLKTCNALGLFVSDKTETDETTKVREKAFDFIMTLINEEDYLKFTNRLKFKTLLPFNQKFANFVYNNYKELMSINYEIASSLLSYAYENAPLLEKVYKNKFGKQLQFTIEMLNQSVMGEEYFSKCENADFVNFIFKYTHKRDEIERLLELYKERQNTPIVLNYFDKMQDLSDSEIKFRTLATDDLLNYVLGYICNCCAKPLEIGEMIMVYALLKNNYRNIIYEDKNGNILGKSTVYVNEESGFAFFNDVEIPIGIEEVKGIYTKLKDASIRAGKELAKCFDICSKNVKMYSVYMGENYNDLLGYFNDFVKTDVEIPYYGTYNLNGDHDEMVVLYNSKKHPLKTKEKDNKIKENKNEL